MPWPKGKPRTTEQRAKISAAHQLRLRDPRARQEMLDNLAKSPSRGGVFSDEHRAAISRGSKGKIRSAEHRTNLSRALKGRVGTHLGHKFTDEWCQHIGDSMRGKPGRRLGFKATPETLAKQSAAMRGKKRGPHTEETKAKMRAARAKQKFMWRNTKPEKHLQVLLTEMGATFRTHLPLKGLGHHQWDVVVTAPWRAIFEVDGCYWHGCECLGRPLTERQIRQKQSDAALTESARAAGWHVIRLWEHDLVSGNLDGIFQSRMSKQGVFEAVR